MEHDASASRATSLLLFFTVAATLLATLAISLSCAAFGAMQRENDAQHDTVAVSGVPSSGDEDSPPPPSEQNADTPMPTPTDTTTSDAPAKLCYTVRLLPDTGANAAELGIYDSRGELIERAPVPLATLGEQDRAALLAGITAPCYTDARQLVADLCS